jgi:predicted DsbA family dithiol-disulfide isomerase
MGPKGEGIDEHLGRRNQWSQSQLQDYRAHLLAVAEQAGVCIDFSKRTHYYNSNKAHRLIHWSEGYNRQQAMNELLIDAYFKRVWILAILKYFWILLNNWVWTDLRRNWLWYRMK